MISVVSHLRSALGTRSDGSTGTVPTSRTVPRGELPAPEPLPLDFGDDPSSGGETLGKLRVGTSLRRRNVTLPGAIHFSGFALPYPGQTIPVLTHFLHVGRVQSHTRRRRRHSQQGRFSSGGVGPRRGVASIVEGGELRDIRWYRGLGTDLVIF